ncbi:MAG TPA: hypothetical protein VHM89_00900 [Acidimicrobiales bacterium]|nr:hypothetical protein [Acidimicrobiales bacterium]
MALAPRRRRGRRPRLLVFGLFATAVVLLVNAAFSSSDNPSRRLAQLAYLDRVRPEIDQSTAQGASLAEVRDDAVRLGRDGATRRVARVKRDADGVVAAVRKAKPPESLATAHSILLATVAIRARVAASMASGLTAALTDGPPEPAVDALVKAGEEMVASDQTYKVFVDAMPTPAGVTAPLLPASTWAPDPLLWTRSELGAFVASIRSSTTLTAVHDVSVLTVMTDPVQVATDGNTAVLPVVKTLRLDIVVANTGNAAEKRVPVVATLVGPAGEVDTARDFIDLAPGQRRAVPLGGLRPLEGGPSTLTVVIGPVDGEASFPDNERSLALVLRG